MEGRRFPLKDCSPWVGTMVEQVLPEGLQPMERRRFSLKDCSPWRGEGSP